jgi:hypothetical protein
LAFAGRVLFLERKRAKEEPLQTFALQDDMWTAQAVRALGRVFVHLELKMVSLAQHATPALRRLIGVYFSLTSPKHARLLMPVVMALKSSFLVQGRGKGGTLSSCSRSGKDM